MEIHLKVLFYLRTFQNWHFGFRIFLTSNVFCGEWLFINKLQRNELQGWFMKMLYRNTVKVHWYESPILYFFLFLTCYIEASIIYYEEMHFWSKLTTETREIYFFFTNTNKILSIPQIILLTHLHANIMIQNDSSIYE